MGRILAPVGVDRTPREKAFGINPAMGEVVGAVDGLGQVRSCWMAMRFGQERGEFMSYAIAAIRRDRCGWTQGAGNLLASERRKAARGPRNTSERDARSRRQDRTRRKKLTAVGQFADKLRIKGMGRGQYAGLLVRVGVETVKRAADLSQSRPFIGQAMAEANKRSESWSLSYSGEARDALGGTRPEAAQKITSEDATCEQSGRLTPSATAQSDGLTLVPNQFAGSARSEKKSRIAPPACSRLGGAIVMGCAK